jgi:hypothetical protein
MRFLPRGCWPWSMRFVEGRYALFVCVSVPLTANSAARLFAGESLSESVAVGLLSDDSELE